MMNEPLIWTTEPILSNASAVWFAAYGFGWGYRAFAISYDAVCGSLGAANTTDTQIHLAFQLGQRRILRAVRQYGSLPHEGGRIWLTLDVLSQPVIHDEIAGNASTAEAALANPTLRHEC